LDLIASTCTDVLERPTLGMCFVCVGASPARRSCPRFLVVVTTTLHLLFVCGGRALRVWCCGGRAFRVWCCGGELRSLLWCRVGSFVLVCTMWWTAAASLCGGFFFVWLWSSAASCGLLLLPCVYGLAGVSQRHAPASRAMPECYSRGTKCAWQGACLKRPSRTASSGAANHIPL